MKKIKKLTLHKAKELTVPQMRNIKGGMFHYHCGSTEGEVGSSHPEVMVDSNGGCYSPLVDYCCEAFRLGANCSCH